MLLTLGRPLVISEIIEISERDLLYRNAQKKLANFNGVPQKNLADGIDLYCKYYVLFGVYSINNNMHSA